MTCRAEKEIMITLLAILLSIVFAGVILLIFGLNPLHIFKEIVLGSVGTELRIKADDSKGSASSYNFTGNNSCF